MTIREFLQNNTVTDVELANGILINLVCGEALYGLYVDMSSIPNGTQLERTKNFTIDENFLISGDNQYNLDLIELL